MKTPQKVKHFLASPPKWLKVASPIASLDAELLEADEGEREAILLAEQMGADAILVDDQKARNLAGRRGHRVIGTLALLEIAANEGLVNFADALGRIKQEGFFVAPSLEADFLRRQDLA